MPLHARVGELDDLAGRVVPIYPDGSPRLELPVDLMADEKHLLSGRQHPQDEPERDRQIGHQQAHEEPVGDFAGHFGHLRAEAGEIDGITGGSAFWKIKLPLILPSIGIISILTFVGNFNAFDLIYTSQGALAGPNFSTDILGTFLYRTFFGFQLQIGDPYMGSAIATAMFAIILLGVCFYLFAIQSRMRRYQF